MALGYQMHCAANRYGSWIPLMAQPTSIGISAVGRDGCTRAGTDRSVDLVARRQGGVSAELGAGTTRKSIPIVRPLTPQTRRSPGDRHHQVPRCTDDEARRHESPPLRICRPGVQSAGIDYPRLIKGEQDFVVSWRTLPWDDFASAFLVNKSGGCIPGDPTVTFTRQARWERGSSLLRTGPDACSSSSAVSFFGTRTR